MGSCMRCGATLADYDAGHDGLCMNCASASSGYGSGTDVPCQRCGMYLPPTELKMWNSRLFCNYCIMDIQDEERMMHPERRTPEKVHGTIPQQASCGAGTCERCGRQADTLYLLSGKKLCPACYFAASGGAPAEGRPSMFGQIIRVAKRALGMKEEPKLIVNQVPQEIVFDLRRRRMVDKKIGVEAQPPLKEERQEPKILRASEKSKKSFFSLIGGKKEAPQEKTAARKPFMAGKKQE